MHVIYIPQKSPKSGPHKIEVVYARQPVCALGLSLTQCVILYNPNKELNQAEETDNTVITNRQFNCIQRLWLQMPWSKALCLMQVGNSIQVKFTDTWLPPRYLKIAVAVFTLTFAMLFLCAGFSVFPHPLLLVNSSIFGFHLSVLFFFFTFFCS